MFGLIPNFLRGGGGGGGSVVAGAACRDYDPTLGQPAHCTCPLLATTFTVDWTCFHKLVPVALGLQHKLYLHMLASSKIVVLLL